MDEYYRNRGIAGEFRETLQKANLNAPVIRIAAKNKNVANRPHTSINQSFDENKTRKIWNFFFFAGPARTK